MSKFNSLQRYIWFVAFVSQISLKCCQFPKDEVQQEPWYPDETNDNEPNGIPLLDSHSITEKEGNSEQDSIDNSVVKDKDKTIMFYNDYNEYNDDQMCKRDAQENGKKKTRLKESNTLIPGKSFKRLRQDRIKNHENQKKLNFLSHKKLKDLFKSKNNEKVKNSKTNLNPKPHLKNNLNSLKVNENINSNLTEKTEKQDDNLQTLTNDFSKSKNLTSITFKNEFNNEPSQNDLNTVSYNDADKPKKWQKKIPKANRIDNNGFEDDTGILLTKEKKNRNGDFLTNDQEKGQILGNGIQNINKIRIDVNSPTNKESKRTENKNILLETDFKSMEEPFSKSNNEKTEILAENVLKKKESSLRNKAFISKNALNSPKNKNRYFDEFTDDDKNGTPGNKDSTNEAEEDNDRPILAKDHKKKFSKERNNSYDRLRNKYYISKAAKEDGHNHYHAINQKNIENPYGEVSNISSDKTLSDEGKTEIGHLEENLYLQDKLSCILSENNHESVINKKHSNRERKKHLEKLGLLDTVQDVERGYSSSNSSKGNDEDDQNKRTQRDTNKNYYKTIKNAGKRIFGYSTKVKDDYELSDIKDEETDLNYEIKTQNKYPKTKNARDLDKYSFGSSYEENEDVSNDDNFDPKRSLKKHFARLSYEPNFYGSENEKENCIDSYKEETSTKQTTEVVSVSNKDMSTTMVSPTTSSSCTITTESSTSIPNNNHDKTKTTLKTRNKPQSTKKYQTEKGNVSSSLVVIDIYEQFLCGQLADDFVNAVQSKVKKARKIYRELGFQNDTEETCDRCIETRPNNMPHLDTIKRSLEKFSENTDQNERCLTCYSVPKPMEKFLNFLISYEKEHENDAYNKIRDDSSFIFTGDYSDQPSRSEHERDNSDKYMSESDSFSKDTFEKPLREEMNEEKASGQDLSKHNSESKKPNAEKEDKIIDEYSTESTVDLVDNPDKNSNSEPNKIPEASDRHQLKSSLELDEKVKGNDVVEDFDEKTPLNNKYLHSNEIERRKSQNRFAKIKNRKGKEFKNEDPKDINDLERLDIKVDKRVKNEAQNDKKRNFGFVESYPLKQVKALPTQIKRDQKHPKDEIPYDQNERYSKMYQYNSDWPNNQNRFNNYYPSENYIEDSHNQRLKKSNYMRLMPTHFEANNWEDDGYLGRKNHPAESPKHVVNFDPKPKFYTSEYGDKLDMVKRDTDASDDEEPLFFEIPDIEYELY